MYQMFFCENKRTCNRFSNVFHFPLTEETCGRNASHEFQDWESGLVLVSREHILCTKGVLGTPGFHALF